MALDLDFHTASWCVEDGDAPRDQVAHALEFPVLVEHRARPEPPGELAVRMGGEVGQHAEVDLRRGDVHGVEHVEAAAFGEMDVEQHQVGPQGEDVADRGHGALRLADDLRAGNRGEHRGEVPAGHEGVFNQENFHAASLRAAASFRRSRARQSLDWACQLQPAQAVANALLERYADGLLPVQRRKARVNALCWE